MFKTLFIHEMQNYLYGLRFRISLIIVLLVFSIGTVSFITSYDKTQENYSKLQQNQIENLRQSCNNITSTVTLKRDFITAPRNNGIISDCKEEVLPNTINYSGYNVFNFRVHTGNINQLMTPTENMNWSFIISMFLSFITLLFTFDAISGEKENHTLALVFSNSISRRLYLFSKLVSVVTVVSLMALIGIIISILIMIISEKVKIDSMFVIETVGFFGVGVLLITIFAAFGLLSSAVTKHSNVSLLISLCFWLFSVVIIPNTSIFWANKLFSIPTADVVMNIIQQEKDDANNNAPKGSWTSSESDPFMPRHELRANLQTQLMLINKKHLDNYYTQMFHQFENTRIFTLLSPVAQFGYVNEALLGGGYLRFRTNWDNLHIFQQQFLQWFKDIDAKDNNSPHWYNPYEYYSTSRLPVDPKIVPQYTEQITSFSRRLSFIKGYLISMVSTAALLFLGCFIFFARYDVR